MTFLLKLIPKINRLDRWIEKTYKKADSWVFYNIRGGFRCSICGAKHLRFNGGQAESKVRNAVTGKDVRMLIQWHGRDGLVCPVCANKAIVEVFENYFHSPTGLDASLDGAHIGTCHFTGEKNIPVIKIIWGNTNSLGIDIRFGAEWWNGFCASYAALETGILNCTMNSSMSSYISGKKYYCSGKYITDKTQTFMDFYKKNFTYIKV